VCARADEDGQVKGLLVEPTTPGSESATIPGKGVARGIWKADIRLDGVRVPEAARLPGARTFKGAGTSAGPDASPRLTARRRAGSCSAPPGRGELPRERGGDARAARARTLDRQPAAERVDAVGQPPETAAVGARAAAFRRRRPRRRAGRPRHGPSPTPVQRPNTVNVQHLESPNDQIAEQTGTRVRETLPDDVRRLQGELDLLWGQKREPSAEEREQLDAPRRLATVLGAHLLIEPGGDVADTVQRIAAERGTT
jgi:Osmosensitive K+ channel His kinase sensor domain